MSLSWLTILNLVVIYTDLNLRSDAPFFLNLAFLIAFTWSKIFSPDLISLDLDLSCLSGNESVTGASMSLSFSENISQSEFVNGLSMH